MANSVIVDFYSLNILLVDIFFLLVWLLTSSINTRSRIFYFYFPLFLLKSMNIINNPWGVRSFWFIFLSFDVSILCDHILIIKSHEYFVSFCDHIPKWFLKLFHNAATVSFSFQRYNLWTRPGYS